MNRDKRKEDGFQVFHPRNHQFRPQELSGRVDSCAGTDSQPLECEFLRFPTKYTPSSGVPGSKVEPHWRPRAVTECRQLREPALELGRPLQVPALRGQEALLLAQPGRLRGRGSLGPSVQQPAGWFGRVSADRQLRGQGDASQNDAGVGRVPVDRP